MSHVDEGTLHAYLDGELSPVESERVRAHLEGCDACRGRIEEERALIERANRLLERAAPPLSGRPVPSLDALAPRSRRGIPFFPLAWAATLLLAVGLGWYLGGEHARQPETVAVQSLPSAPPVVALPGKPTTVVTTAPRQDAARQSSRLDVRAPASRALESEQVTKSRIDTTQVVIAAPSPAVEASNAAGQAQAAAANPIVPRDEVSSKAPAAEGWTEVSADSARALLGGRFATIPGLAISRIQKSGVSGNVVLVTFMPDPRTTIQIYEQVAENDQMMRAKTSQAQAFTQRMARYVAGLRVEITGTVGADSLNRLLEAVR